MSEALLEIRNLRKTFLSQWTYRPIEAIRNVSFSVMRGEAFGFLGHNGAGKTTTIKCIIGLIRKNGGDILFEGAPLCTAQQRSCFGFLPELPYFYDHLTVEETLRLFASLHAIPDSKAAIAEALARVKLSSRLKTPVRSLSKGLQQRLGIAQAILNRPKFLLLDEPFSGLDPLGRAEIRQLILDLKQSGATVFLSSHILSDIEDICDRVAIMAKGELRATLDLVHRMPELADTYELVIEPPAGSDLPPNLVARGSVLNDSRRALALRFPSYAEALQTTEQVLRDGLCLVSFRRTAVRLEEIFVRLTREAGVEAA